MDNWKVQHGRQFCRFVGYLEEQAVVTYSDILQKMDEGKLPMWSRLPAPEIAAKYWKLGEGGMMRDVILAIRLVLNLYWPKPS